MAQTPPRSSRNKKEWHVPPSPRSLEAMYFNLRQQHDELKEEVKAFLARLLNCCREHALREVILQEEPLLKIYEYMLEASQSKKQEVATYHVGSNAAGNSAIQNPTQRDVSLIVISDDSSSEI
ncbi:hypothetical protein OROMI_022227 [Orobanche minor]